MLNQPELLILDEPTNGLDPNGQKLVRDLLLYISNKTTVFLSSHNLEIIEEMCNRVAIIKKRLLFCERIDTLSGNGTVSYSLLFEDKIQCMKIINEIQPLDFNIIRNKVVITVSEDKKHTVEQFIDGHAIRILNTVKSNSKLENLYFSVMKEATDESV